MDLTSRSQGEVYVAICVACAPSLAKVWRVDFKQTRFYNTFMSFLHSARTTKQGYHPSTQGRGSPSESVSALHQKQSFTGKKPSHSFNSVHGADSHEMIQNPV
jgi:hypothetical protein